MMVNLIGKQVAHKKYGKGKVIAQDGGKITVLFDDGVKKEFNIVEGPFEPIISFPDLTLEELKEIEKERETFQKNKAEEGQRIADRIAEKKAKEEIKTIQAKENTRGTKKPQSQGSFSKIEKQLVSETAYGTSAKDIYERCCKEFGWEVSLANNFGWQKHNYAEMATPEGYSVWFIMNSNRTQSGEENNYNEIEGDFIREQWNTRDITSGQHMVGENRVVFVKNDKYHVFLGVYEAKGVVKDRAIYQRISEVYPV